MTTTAGNNQIVIVGGGIYGASLAHDLAVLGKKVMLLEADEIASGASGGPGERGVRACNRDLRELPIVSVAQQRWQELQETIEGGVGYRRIGGIQVFDVPYGYRQSEIAAELEARAMVQTAMGIPTRLVGRNEILEMEPELAKTISGGLYCPNDGVGDHTFATRQLAQAAVKAGAAIRTGAKVTEIVHRDGMAIAVRLASGEIVTVGEHLVLVANAGVLPLLRPLLQPHELMPVWQLIPQMMYVTNPDHRKIRFLLSHKHRRLAVKQLLDGTIMLSGGWSVEHGDNQSLHGSLSATALNVSDAIATFPFLDGSMFETVDASRVETCALDGVPIIGRPALANNLTYGFAWTGHGFAISLGFSKYMTEWIMTGRQPPQLQPFSPDRFCPHP